MGTELTVVETVWDLTSLLHGIGANIIGGKLKSIHFRQKGNGPNTHKLLDRMAYTWRSAAFDFWKDPSGGNADQYWVQGYHYYMNNNGTKVYDNYTQSGDCSGYNGWWDKDKARG